MYIKCWQAYLDTPQTPYVQRSYDGVGLFGHEGDLTSQESIWAKLLPMIVARVGQGGSDTVARGTYCWAVDRIATTAPGVGAVPGRRHDDWNMRPRPRRRSGPDLGHHRQRRRPAAGGERGGLAGTRRRRPPSRATPTSGRHPGVGLRRGARPGLRPGGHPRRHQQRPQAVPQGGRLQVPRRLAGRLRLHPAGRRLSWASTAATTAWPPTPPASHLTSSASSPIPSGPMYPGQPPGSVEAAAVVEARPRSASTRWHQRGRSPPGPYDGAYFDLQVAGELVLVQVGHHHPRSRLGWCPSPSSSVAVNQLGGGQVVGDRVTVQQSRTGLDRGPAGWHPAGAGGQLGRHRHRGSPRAPTALALLGGGVARCASPAWRWASSAWSGSTCSCGRPPTEPGEAGRGSSAATTARPATTSPPPAGQVLTFPDDPHARHHLRRLRGG